MDEIEGSFGVLQPIRRPHVTSKSKHMPGKWFSGICGRHIQYDSLLEKASLVQLEFDADFTDLVEQPFRLRFQVDGKMRSHVPDFLLRSMTGELTLVDVKPARKAVEEKFVEQFASTRAFCEHAGIQYRIMSEPDPQLLKNLQWLAGYRSISLNESTAFSRMWTMLSREGVSIEDLLRDAGEECLARPALFAALWSRFFATDLFQPFESQTEIRRVDVS